MTEEPIQCWCRECGYSFILEFPTLIKWATKCPDCVDKQVRAEYQAQVLKMAHKEIR